MQIFDKIKLFLLDMDGTVYLGNKLYDGAAAAIQRIRSSGRKICFLTNNSSKTRLEYINKLARLGIDIDEEEIFTSNDVAIQLLTDRYSGQSVYLVATDTVKKQYEQANIQLTEQQPNVVVLTYDTSITYDKLAKITRYITKGAVFIATHPDINCPSEDVYLPDVGAFLAAIKESTGKTPDIICGKPYTFMGEAVMKKFSLGREQIAMVGDRLYTDIMFGINNKFLSTLVLTGETVRENLVDFNREIDVIINSIADIRF